MQIDKKKPAILHRPQSLDMEELEEALTSIVGAILQSSDRVAGTIVGVAASKLVAAGVMAGTFGAIGLVGAASTGIAIATLSGAAATNATLFWIGSSFGLGVAGGGVILMGGAITLGIPAAIYARKHLLGRPRTEENLSDQGQAVLYAALQLAAAVKISRLEGAHPSSQERRLVAEHGISSIVDGLNAVFLHSNPEDGQCVSPKNSTAWWPRYRLQRGATELDRLAKKWSGV